MISCKIVDDKIIGYYFPAKLTFSQFGSCILSFNLYYRNYFISIERVNIKALHMSISINIFNERQYDLNPYFFNLKCHDLEG